MKKPSVLVLLSTVFFIVLLSCSNTNINKSAKDDTIIEDTVLIETSTEFEIKYLEDFNQFETHEQVIAYFGKDNVLYEEQDFGAGWLANTSIIYPHNQNQIMIVWNEYTPEDGNIFFISQYLHYDADKLEQGGAEYPYKSGLKQNMSLNELIELNVETFDFYDFYFSLGGQFAVGMIIKDKLKPELQDYIIHLEYAKKIDYDKPPADFEYLHEDKIISSDDKRIITENIKVKGIKYSPCKCTIWE